MRDLPKTDGSSLFFLSRTGRYNWLLGQILFGLMSALTFLATIYVICTAFLMGRAFLADGWSMVVKRFDLLFPEKIGIIIETPGFIPYYSGFHNLKLLAGLNRRIDSDRIKESMQKVGLNPNLKLQVRKYSLGMRQRLGLAQAIMENPDLLILDEPMNGLDKEGVADMRRYLLELKEQVKTILIASHNSEDISALCDTVCEMAKGAFSEAE
ncbi:MAG: ATP-binding cassette domain-containing protein [Oscillospiraceae bacterium]|nr:ATP-binding cassette domain-containing protein [Oscillospiraceae bacterium]